jgi:hypothetical protein
MAPASGFRRQTRSASAKAPASANRSSGSRDMARMTIASSPGGCGRPTAVGLGGSSLSRFRATAAAESASNGRRPVSISYRTIPSEYTSEAPVTSSPRACSGLK